jgi:hypothetical protein
VVSGVSFDPLRGRRGCVWRFDGTDKLLWQKPYGTVESFARGVAATPDGGAVVVGATQATGAMLRPSIFGIDRLGQQRWTAP